MSEIKRIDAPRLKRLQNSVNGNPRYRVTFTDGTSAVTKSDAAFCYLVDNPELRGDVVVTFAGNGQISDISPAS